MTNRLRLATLLPGATKVRAGQLNPVWRGRALTEDGALVAVYVKRLDRAALLADCVGSLLARACGLGAPAPLLVDDPQQTLGAANGLPLFGLEDADHRSMRQWIEDGDDIAVQEALLAWPNLRACCVLDEALANVDRNPGNLLWDGDSEFVPIDHDFALGGPLRHPLRPVQADETVSNLLADRLYAHYGLHLEGARLEKAARELVEAWRLIDVARLAEPSRLHKIQATQWAEDVLALVMARIANADALLRRRARDHHQRTLGL